MRTTAADHRVRTTSGSRMPNGTKAAMFPISSRNETDRGPSLRARAQFGRSTTRPVVRRTLVICAHRYLLPIVNRDDCEDGLDDTRPPCPDGSRAWAQGRTVGTCVQRRWRPSGRRARCRPRQHRHHRRTWPHHGVQCRRGAHLRLPTRRSAGQADGRSARARGTAFCPQGGLPEVSGHRRSQNDRSPHRD